MPALTFDDLVPQKGENGATRLYVNAADAPSKSGALTFDDLIPKSTASKVLDTATGVGKAVVSGLDKGVAGLAGLPADAALGINAAVNYGKSFAQGRPFDEVEAESDKNALISRDAIRAWGGQAAHRNSPLRSEPRNTTEKYIQSAAEFVPGALIPGASVRNAVTLGIAPGLASEAAGQATEGTAAEPWARAGAAVATGGLGAWLNAPNSAGNAVSSGMRGVTQQQVDDAERLFQLAQQERLPITRAEAIQHVTNGATNMGNLQRVVEGSGGMREFFAQRPGQVDAGARRTFDHALGPNAADPSNIGTQLGEAAQDTVRGVQGAINRASRPYYQAAEQQRVGPQVGTAFAGDPLYAQTLQEIRNNPALNRTIAHLPDDSVGVIDLVQRRMREQADNALVPGQANSSNLAASNFEDARTAPMAAADTVTGSSPGVAGSYETARNIQTQLRQQYLEPLMSGPIGKLAARDPTTQRAISVLFPANPLPNSQGEIAQAITALSVRNPRAAQEVLRAHAESVFNEATQRLQSGANEFAGAGFAAILRGNPQQAQNLEAALTALRGGQAYRGMDEFLTVLEAMGSRQRIGSQTAFNQEVQSALKEGGTVASALSGAATGGIKVPQQIRDAIQRWRLGQNVNQIADVLTNPAAAPLFRQLANAHQGSARAAALTTRLVYIATQDARTK